MTEMFDNPRRPIRYDDDDVFGHGLSPNRADADTSEGDDDTEGHRIRYADAETSEGDDDTEGHRIRYADAETSEGDDDTEGHRMR